MSIQPRAPVAQPSLTRPDWTKSQARDPKLLWLDKNENLDPVLAKFTTSLLKEIDSTALYTYPECAPLYQQLSELYGLPIEHFILAAGSDGVIRYTFEAYVGEGDSVVHTAPTFAMYPVYSMMYGAKVTTLAYEPSENGPLLTLDRVLKTIETVRPRLFCLPNPDSPTGTVYSPDELETIIRTAENSGSIALIDEAYFPFYAHTAAALTKKYSNLIVARTFAKAWGLAGLRIGYAIASPAVAPILHKVRPMYEVNTFAVEYMRKMLSHRDEMQRSVERLNDGKAHFLREMNQLGFRTLRGHGNFLHVAFGEKENQMHESLKDLVLYRQRFNEPCLKGFSRFSTAPREILQPVIDRIIEVAKK